MFQRLGAAVHRRRKLVIGLWAVVVVLGAALGPRVFERLTADQPGNPHSEAARVAHRVRALTGTGHDVVATFERDGRAGQGLRADVARAADDVRAIPGVHSVLDPSTADVPGLVSTDGRAFVVVVALHDHLHGHDVHTVGEAISDRFRAVDADVAVGGSITLQHEFRETAEKDLQRGEMIAIPIALIAMVVILGGIIAAGLPIAVAIAGVLATMIALFVATALVDVSVFAMNVVTMLGLGLGVDYGLLVVNRFREERADGAPLADAVARTVATAGTTVVFSALTVAVALVGLFVFDEPAYTSFGIGGIAVVLLTMAAGITLLPALLSVFAARIKPARAQSGDDGYFARVSRFVQRRAGLVVIVVGLGLVALAVPFTHAEFGMADARSLPRSSEARRVATTLAERFPARGAEPVVVLADVDGGPALDAFTDRLHALPGVAGVTVRPAADPRAPRVVDVVPTGASQGPAARELVERIRDLESGFGVQVGGVAAELVDFERSIADRLPVALGLIALSTFVLLFLMTGSIAVPLKAIVMNVLSLGATFGALVWVFQDGHLSGLLGFDPVGSVDLFMPVLVFIFAFGLSMDYEVFLLGRIKEVHDETGDNDLAVAVGLQRTGRIITSAALLITVVFAGFAAGETLAIKQLGFGMAVAIVVDATIVRSLLVPTTMKLLGEWNWWAPAPLRRLHDHIGLREPAAVPSVARP